MQVLKVLVKPQKDRLDQFVSDSIKSISRSSAKNLIKEGFILVNDHGVDPSYRVRKNDKVIVERPAQKEVSLQPEKIDLKIVYEDTDIIVIDKQPFLVTHPTLDHPSGTVVNALLFHLKDLGKSDSLRPGIVHRLDKNTSGLLVIAKNENSLENLKRQFKERSVKKEYLALVNGEVEKEWGIIEGAIGRHPKFKQKFILDPAGKEAVTEYRVIKRYPKFTLVSLHPLTGRTHQLRVHLSHLRHPIVGDKLYGGKMILNRQFLHASKLEITHPTSAKKLIFESELPGDLKAILEKLNIV